jgi:O-antigen/teichoic acid export membrane protein
MYDGRPESLNDLSTVVVRGVGLAAVGYIATQLATLAAYMALARLATPREFGVFAAGSTIVGFGLAFSESGMLAALVQRRENVAEAASTAFVATVLGGLLLSLVALAFAPLLDLYFRSHEIGLVAAAMSGYILVRQSMIVPDALMQRRFSFVRRVILEPIGMATFGATAIPLAAVGLGAWALVCGSYAGLAVQALLSFALIDWRPARALASVAMWRELAAFGRHVVVSEGLRIVQLQSRVLLIGRFLGAGALGQYTYAFRLASQPVGVLVAAVGYVLMPALSRISDDEVRFRAAVVRALRSVSIFAFGSLLLIGLGEPLVVVLFGAEWREAGRAVAAMAAFSTGLAMDSLASETWKAAGEPQWLPRMHALGAALALGVTAALLPAGLVAVGAGLSGTALTVGVFALWGLARVIGVRFRSLAAELWPPAAAGVTSAAVLLAAERELRPDAYGPFVGGVLLLALGAGGVAVYVAATAAASRPHARELQRIFAALRAPHTRVARAEAPSETALLRPPLDR